MVPFEEHLQMDDANARVKTETLFQSKNKNTKKQIIIIIVITPLNTVESIQKAEKSKRHHY